MNTPKRALLEKNRVKTATPINVLINNQIPPLQNPIKLNKTVKL